MENNVKVRNCSTCAIQKENKTANTCSGCEGNNFCYWVYRTCRNCGSGSICEHLIREITCDDWEPKL